MKQGIARRLVLGALGVGVVGLLGASEAAAASKNVIKVGKGRDQIEVDISELPRPVKRKVDFMKDVYPIFKESCFKCHGPESQKGDDYRLDQKKVAMRKDPEEGTAIVPGKSEMSRLIHMVARLPEDDDLWMPPPNDEPDEQKPLKKKEIAVLRAWIDQGAKWPKKFTTPEEEPVNFAKEIKPILKGCFNCHGAKKQAGELRLDTREGALKGGWIYGPTIVPGDSEASPIIFITQGQDTQIPHLEKHKLEDDQVALLKRWIDQGAKWKTPEEVSKEKAPSSDNATDSDSQE